MEVFSRQEESINLFLSEKLKKVEAETLCSINKVCVCVCGENYLPVIAITAVLVKTAPG